MKETGQDIGEHEGLRMTRQKDTTRSSSESSGALFYFTIKRRRSLLCEQEQLSELIVRRPQS